MDREEFLKKIKEGLDEVVKNVEEANTLLHDFEKEYPNVKDLDSDEEEERLDDEVQDDEEQ